MLTLDSPGAQSHQGSGWHSFTIARPHVCPLDGVLHGVITSRLGPAGLMFLMSREVESRLFLGLKEPSPSISWAPPSYHGAAHLQPPICVPGKMRTG